eukprot:g1045.t1
MSLSADDVVKLVEQITEYLLDNEDSAKRLMAKMKDDADEAKKVMGQKIFERIEASDDHPLKGRFSSAEQFGKAYAEQEEEEEEEEEEQQQQEQQEQKEQQQEQQQQQQQEEEEEEEQQQQSTGPLLVAVAGGRHGRWSCLCLTAGGSECGGVIS